MDCCDPNRELLRGSGASCRDGRGEGGDHYARGGGRGAAGVARSLPLHGAVDVDRGLAALQP